MISYVEMLEIADRFWDGQRFNVVGIRKELTYNWAFDECQVQRIIWDMKKVGILY